jgi:flagellar protein FlaJ
MISVKLRRIFREKVERRPERYIELKKFLEASRLKITLPELLSLALFFPLISAPIVGSLCYLGINYLGRGILYADILGIRIEFWKIQLVVAVGFSILAFFITRYAILSYPYFVATLRKGRIDSLLPHVVNMMFGMAKGNLPLSSIFRFIAENKALFGEVSVEFERIVVIAEFKDLESAMKYVAETTPSERLRIFLENLIEVYRSRGDVLDYLKSKSEQFFMERERSYILLIEAIQIIAEIYLALFIVAPLFILIVLTVMRMLGGNAITLYKILIYTLIPIGSCIIIFIVYSSVLKERKELGEIKEEIECLPVPISNRRENRFRFKKLRKLQSSIVAFLTRPLYETPYLLKLRDVALYFLTPGMIYFVIFLGKMEFDYLAFSTILSIGIPVILFVEYRERLIRKAEKELPEFLKQMASLSEAGLNVVEALKNISESGASIIGREIKIVKRYLEWGEIVTKSISKLERRVRSAVFQKALSIFVKSIEVSPSIGDALYSASKFLELEIEIKERLRGVMSTYVIIIYLAYAVFLYTTYVLIKNLLIVLPSVQSGMVSINIFEVKSLFMETSLLVAVFSGLVGGVVQEGRIEAGLKHVFIFLVITYVFFKFLI